MVILKSNIYEVAFVGKNNNKNGNSKLITWDFNKTAEMEIQDALLSERSLELMTGSKLVTGKEKIHMRQATEWIDNSGTMEDKGDLYPLTANAQGEITLAFTPTTPVADIIIYEADDDAGTPIVGTSTLTGNVLKNASLVNKKVVVYYQYESVATAQTLMITADKFAGTYKIVGDTVLRNAKTQKDEKFQIVINNYKVKTAFDLAFQAKLLAC